MNRKQLLTLLVLVVVVGGAGLVLYQKRNSSFQPGGADMGRKLLGNFPVNDVTRIAIRQDTNAVNLVKTNGLWRVQERGDYPASFSQISQFLLKARGLKIAQSLQVGPSQLGRLDLAPPGDATNAALEVAFYAAHDKPISTLLLGKQHMKQAAQPSQFGGDDNWPDGRYVKVSGADDVAVVADPLDSAQPQPASWLDKDFFKVQNPETIRVTFPQATNSWELTRTTETGAWQLADAKPGEKLDSSKISGVTDAFGSPSFSDVWPGDKPSELGTNQPAVVKISTFDHFHYTVRVGEKTNDDYLVAMTVSADIPQTRPPGKDEKPADKAKLDAAFEAHRQQLENKLKQEQGFRDWTYLVPSWTVDPVLKRRSQLLVVAKTEAKKQEKTSAATPGAGKTKEPAATVSHG